MAWIKALHLIAVFIWIGSLMTLTRFMGYHVKENVETQMRLAKLYKRIYNLVQFPTMLVAVALGIVLAAGHDFSFKPGWFYAKFAFAMGLVCCDYACGQAVNSLNQEPDIGRGVKYKILHGMTGLFLIGILISSSVFRDKTGEVLNKQARIQAQAEAIIDELPTR